MRVTATWQHRACHSYFVVPFDRQPHYPAPAEQNLATSAPQGATPSAQIRASHRTNPQVTELRCSQTRHSDKSQVIRQFWTTTVTTITRPTTVATGASWAYRAWSRIPPGPGSVGSGVRFHPLHIRRAVGIACSEPSRLVQPVQLDQHKRLAFDFASASHAEGRWFDVRHPGATALMGPIWGQTRGLGAAVRPVRCL